MERRNDVPNLLAMYNCIIKKINKGVQPQLQHNENHNQRSRQTVIQVRRNNTHKTGKTASGPGTCQIHS